jgi:hypothetical protein
LSSTFLANTSAKPNIPKQMQTKFSWRSETLQIDRIETEARKSGKQTGKRIGPPANPFRMKDPEAKPSACIALALSGKKTRKIRL